MTKSDRAKASARQRLVIRGTVQGVGYRALVRQVARRLGIRGLVRNLPDGTVEIFCDGPKPTLAKFRKLIAMKSERHDLFNIDVTHVQAYSQGDNGYVGAPKTFQTFEVDYGPGTRPAEKEMLERFELATGVLYDMSDGLRSGHAMLGGKIDSGNSMLAEKIDSGNQMLAEKIDAGNRMLAERIDSGNKMLAHRIDSGNKTLAGRIEAMHADMNTNFGMMATRYDRISRDMKGILKQMRQDRKDFRGSIEKLVKAILAGRE